MLSWIGDAFDPEGFDLNELHPQGGVLPENDAGVRKSLHSEG
jgi:hypothetical protein